MARRYAGTELGRVLRDADAKDRGDPLGYLEARPDRTGLTCDQRAELEDDVDHRGDRGEPFRADAAAVYRATEAIRPSCVVPVGNVCGRN